MKLTAQLKLLPTPQQAAALKRTLEAANAACNAISQVAWEVLLSNMVENSAPPVPLVSCPCFALIWYS
jgi:hypothetical protein